MEDGRARGASKRPQLQEDVASVRVHDIHNLCRFLSAGGAHSLARVLTFFHAAACSAFQIPGACSMVPAAGAMIAASDTKNVPGTRARCA